MSIHDMKHDAFVRHPLLPKASWLFVSFRGFSMRNRRLAKFRMANTLMLRFFGIEVVIRRPWLAGSARQLHPELFEAKP